MVQARHEARVTRTLFLWRKARKSVLDALLMEARAAIRRENIAEKYGGDTDERAGQTQRKWMIKSEKRAGICFCFLRDGRICGAWHGMFGVACACLSQAADGLCEYKEDRACQLWSTLLLSYTHRHD